MRKTKFTEEQMMDATKQLEAGRRAKGLARELAINGQTLYHWRAKSSGLEVNEAQLLRALEEENRGLKAPARDLTLDREAVESPTGLPGHVRP
jgi:putative transposase